MSRKSKSKLEQQIEEQNLIKIKVDDLKFDKTNPNRLTQDQMTGLRRSITRFGYLTPIIIDQNNQIADGEHRALIYKEYGIKEIPAFKLNLKDDSERRILRQIMNKLHGEHDRQLDADELVQIFKAGKLDDLSQLIAQETEDLQRAMLRYHPSLDFVTPENQDEIDRLIDDELKRLVPDTQLGDLYQLGNHRLICGDCTDERMFKRLMDGQIADMVLTDPPYNTDFAYNSYDDTKKSDKEYTDFCTLWFNLLKRYVRDLKIIITPGMRNQGIWENIQKPLDRGVWYKSNSLTRATLFRFRACEPILFYGEKNDGYYCHNGKATGNRVTDFFDFPSQITAETKEAEANLGIEHHAPAKPLNFWMCLINEYSRTNDLILDVFLGSGTSLIGCEQTGRKCYGIEIDPHYCDIIVKRWEAYTNKKAIKIEK